LNNWSRFRAKTYSKQEIWECADKFRDKYSAGKIPVDIDAILDFDLKIRIHERKGLYKELNINAFLSNDTKEIFVDEDDYFDDGKSHFMRYTLAHEIGHLELHKDYLPTLRAKTVKDWIEIKSMLPESQYRVLEYQAYEFAGRLLVPPKLLKEKIKEESKNIELIIEQAPDLPISDIEEHLSSKICKHFGVSSKVILKRIENEEIDIRNL
jgi:Zn-dependent peptidase ImmA (M78 family)